MTTKEFPLPAVEIFATQTRREIIKYLLERAQQDGAVGRERQWHTISDIEDNTSVSRESLRKELSSSDQILHLLELGVVVVRNPDVNIRHYQLAKTYPARTLYENDHLIDHLIELFDSPARRKLITFFLDEADPEETYTKYALAEELGVSYNALRDHMPILFRHDIIGKQEGSRSDEYFIAESPLTEFLRMLNESLSVGLQSE